MAIPNVKKQDIIDALKYIDENGIPPHNQSTRYELVIDDGKKYPPKYAIAVANHLANGENISTENFNAVEAKNFLENLGFIIENKNQEIFELSITANKIESTDDEFTMDNLSLGDNYEPIDTYFQDAKGNIVKRTRRERERNITNQTMPRIAFQIFEKQISNLSDEEKKNFPICQYSPDGTIFRGIYSSVEEYKKYRNSRENMQYHYGNGKKFVIYVWNIFSTIIFVQECLKRFGNPGDIFILKYTKKEKAKIKTETSISAWLLSWNPDKWTWTTYQEDIENIKQGKEVEERYSCVSKQPKVGDRAFLIKLGQKEPKGIIASGYISSETFMDIAEHRNDNKEVNNVKIKFDKILDYNKCDILQQSKLKELFPNQEWSTQSSGISIKEEYLNELENLWKDYDNKTKEDANKHDNISLNQVLYGPPGTGKTYNTIVEAIKILNKTLYEEYKSESKTYNDLKKEFDTLKEQGRIEFVTFHQSYSYEEFIEGIKPEIDWEGNKENQEMTSNEINYVGKDGIFKRTCEKAKDKLYKNLYEDINFEEIIKRLKSEIKENPYINMTKNRKFEIKEILEKEQKAKYLYGTTKTQKNILLNKMEALLIQNKNYDNADSFFKDYNHESYSVRYYPFAFYNNLLRIKKDLLKEKELRLQNKKEMDLNAEKYVLIIDEINRGNISKIFGEMITLIEEDKRLGKENELTITLPYSQYKDFGVPSNLYIIGTMNTSDRSIASVDIALRRRFKFKEMMPQSELVADFGCKFEDKFKILNKKISILLDRDHQIGHSYFINDKYKNADINTLKNIWFDSIMPLLNEYFYGDWEKLQEILGKAAEEEKSKEEKQIFKSFIKKLDNKCIKSSCYDATTDCFDFVREDEVDFKAALDNAFKKEEE